MQYSDQELEEYHNVCDRLTTLGGRINGPTGWFRREMDETKVVYQHVELPLVIVLSVKSNISPDAPAVHGRVLMYGSITFGEYEVGEPDDVMTWAYDWMKDNLHPIEVFEDSSCSWWPGKRTPSPSTSRFTDIAVVREAY